MPCPPARDLPNPGTEPRSPTLQVDSLPAEPQGKPKNTGVGSLSLPQLIFLTQELNQSLLHCSRILYQLSYSVQFSLSVMSDSVRPHRWQPTRILLPGILPTPVFLGFPCGSAGKESACNAGDPGLIPGLRRFPGEGKGSPLQYPGLEKPMDCIARGVTKGQTH